MHQYPIIDCCFVVGVVWPCTSIENRNQNPAPLKNMDTRHLSRIPWHEMRGLCFYLHYWCNCCSLWVAASFLSCDPSFHPEKSSRNQSGNCVWQIANLFGVSWSYFQMLVCSVKLFFWLKSLVFQYENRILLYVVHINQIISHLLTQLKAYCYIYSNFNATNLQRIYDIYSMLYIQLKKKNEETTAFFPSVIII